MTSAGEILLQLKALGSEQTRKTWRRHGVREPMFGVKYGDLEKLRKQLGRSQPLARALWQSGNHDARVLAAMIAEPAAFDLEALLGWQREATCNVQTDALITHVGAHSPAAHAALAAWLAAEDASELSARRAGWVLASHLAREDLSLADSFFAPLVARIVRELHAAPNRTREAMNWALISFGARSDALAALATAAAHELGPVTIDHGDTACKTPDAAAYIARARQHRAKQQAKAAKKPARAKKPAAKRSPAKALS